MGRRDNEEREIRKIEIGEVEEWGERGKRRENIDVLREKMMVLRKY